MKILLLLILMIGCGQVKYMKTVDHIDIKRFMGDWYVPYGRTSFLEKGAHNSLEQYKWNEDKKRIDIQFTYLKNSFEGKRVSIPQKAWIENQNSNAHWKVQPIWPLKLDYLVIALDPNYQWTVIGVPSQSYLWLMTREPMISEELKDKILKQVEETGYDVHDIKKIPQKWI